MPLVLTLGLALMSFVPRVQDNPVLVRSFWAAAMVLVVWQAAMFLRLKGEPAGCFIRVELRSQHYLQATIQAAVFAYWGYYWRPVYDYAWLLLAQLVFAGDVLRSLSKKKMYGSPNSNPSPELGADKENHTSWERYYQVSDCSSSLRNDWYSGI